MVTMNIEQLFLLALATGSISAYIAIRKKKSPLTWFIVGFFFGVPGIIFNFLSNFKQKSTFQKPNFQKLIKKPVLKAPPPPENIDRRLWYFLDQKHEQYGPMSLHALKEEWKSKKIGPKTFVWNDEMDSWKKIEQLSDFEELFYGRPKRAQSSQEKTTNSPS